MLKPGPLRDRAARQRFAGLALAGPAVLVLVGLAIVPVLVVVRDSFARADQYGGIVGGFTLDNYRELMDPAYLHVLWYSLTLAVVNTVACLVVGYLTASYLVSRPPARQSLLLMLVVVPFWTDFLVRTFAWINLLSPSGPVATVLRAVHLAGDDASWVPSQAAVVLGLVYAFLPTSIFPIYASLRSIDPSLADAAADLGCSWWQTQRRVLVPLCRSGLIGAAVLTFVPTLGVFVIPVLLGGGKQQLVGNVIVTLYTEFRNQPMGAAASVIVLAFMALSLALAAVAIRTGARRTPEEVTA